MANWLPDNIDLVANADNQINLIPSVSHCNTRVLVTSVELPGTCENWLY